MPESSHTQGVTGQTVNYFCPFLKGAEDLNLFISTIKHLVKDVSSKLIKKRGRPPKHNPRNYLMLIAAKEFDKKSLRGAETRLSKEICNERVDHSVIAYWENKKEVSSIFK